MATRMQQRRGTAAQWTASNPVLGAGEIGFETDTNKFKIGNGSTAWTSLSYFIDGSSLIDGAPDLLNTLNELAAALGDDPAFFTTVANNLANSVSVLSNSQTATSNALGVVQADVATISNSIGSIQNNISTQSDTIQGLTNSLTSHSSANTNVHGISNTANLAYMTDISAVNTSISTSFDTVSNSITSHSSATANVHGIANAAAIVYTADLEGVSNTLSTHSSATANVHGISNTLNLVYTNDSRLSDERTPVSDSVTTAKIANAAVTGTKIAENAISQSHLSDDAVGTNEIGGFAVTTGKIANAAVTSEKIAEGAVTKTMVGLSDVDNTSDANKPVSSATQTALDAKASLAGATFTGSVEIDQDLTVDGNFIVNGSNVIVSATQIQVEDTLLQLGHTNANNITDLGLVVGYNDGASKHAGIVKDVTDGKWKLFKDLTVEPATTVDFSSASLDILSVGTLESANGVAFSDGTQAKEGVPSRTPIISKTASYTLSAESERDSLIEVSSESGTTITIPLNSAVAYPVGTTLDILQTNTGQVTIAGDAGVTVNATPGLKLRTRWSSATLFKRDTNTWVVFGDLTA
jgi:hypothetical protein